MRFQPIIGNLLAAAADKVVSIFDVETDRQIHTFQVCIFFTYLFMILFHMRLCIHSFDIVT